MNQIVIDSRSVQQAVSLLAVLFSIATLLGVVLAVLQIAQFFRRAPPIDQTITALVKEFQKELAQRVLISDFEKSEARHERAVRDMETRTDKLLDEQERRADARMQGLHASIVEVRKMNESILLNIQALVKDMSREKR